MITQPCSNAKRNGASCNCTYEGCSRHGHCCDCLQFHLKHQQLPACCFPADVEASYDRSFAQFVKTYQHLAK